MRASGLLIVNADDWGGFQAGTDAIEACFQIGAISSATGMVHMADSRRAAELAQASGRSIGLHLNLTQAFDSGGVPLPVRERQRRLRAHFADLSRRRWLLSPDARVHRLIADAIRDQLDEFHSIYGCEPTHIDSHHHVHVCPDVFLSRALAPGLRVRQTLSPTHDDGRRKLARRAKHKLLAHRFLTTDRFWRARELSGVQDSVPIDAVVQCAAGLAVEVMVHPSFQSEFAVLRSEAWIESLARASLGSYSELLPRPSTRARRI